MFKTEGYKKWIDDLPGCESVYSSVNLSKTGIKKQART